MIMIMAMIIMRNNEGGTYQRGRRCGGDGQRWLVGALVGELLRQKLICSLVESGGDTPGFKDVMRVGSCTYVVMLGPEREENLIYILRVPPSLRASPLWVLLFAHGVSRVSWPLKGKVERSSV